MINQLYCPKCNSTNVVVETIEAPEDVRYSIDEWENRNSFSYIKAVMVIKRVRATCQDCGYFKERNV